VNLNLKTIRILAPRPHRHPHPSPRLRPQCWAQSPIYLLTRGPPSSNNIPNSLNHNNPRMFHPMSLLHPSTAKTSPSQMCFIFFNPNGANMNAIATSGRLSELRCEHVVWSRLNIVLPFHDLLFFQARIALLEGERRSFENIKVDLMRRIKMLEYALRVERFVPILPSALSMDVTCLTRAARNNSHNPPLSHPSRSPQRWPLCNLLPRRTRHPATRKVVVPALLVVKVFHVFYSSPSLADAVKDSPLPPERGPNGTSAAGSTRASAWAGPSSSGWTNTNGPASTAAIGKPSLGRDPKSRARSRDYLKQYALDLKKLSIHLCLPDACKRYNISLPLKR
jgi:hypothetical protein